MARNTAMADTERRLGRYRLFDEIERNGDARLYRALDANGRTVILWTVPLACLRAAQSVEGDALERFRRMAAAAARLVHPAIPAVLASGEHAGIGFVATAPVEGPTIATRLEAGPVILEDSVATLDRVLDALGAAHRAGVVHGALDIKAIRRCGAAAMVTGFGQGALTASSATLCDDLDAARRLAERLLADHADRPDVAALLTRVRDEGTDAFPDAAALRCAVCELGKTPAGAPAAQPRRDRHWPMWLGSLALAGGAVLVVAQQYPPSSPPLPQREMPRENQTAVPSALSLPVPTPRRPPVAAVAQALRSVACTLLTVEDVNGRLLVSGTVAGDQAGGAVRDAVGANAAGWDYGLDLMTADAQFCAPLGTVAAALDANRRLGTPLATTMVEGPALNAGDSLALEIRAPAWPVDLRVDYFTIDGSVVHLLPNPSDHGTALAAGALRRLGDRAEGERHWTVGPPYGTEMLLTIATPKPLFPTARPEQEPAADYLAALARALASLPDDAPAPLATVRFIATGP
ncbi:DUF4384 domain-containing protein [Azospirillum sp. HJ39]|uniref:DUF4384 domain-containing protein n=1 Tax=Azospirillum sp. HJ39 TaxID=3159496 RepID=UPI003558F7E9